MKIFAEDTGDEPTPVKLVSGMFAVLAIYSAIFAAGLLWVAQLAGLHVLIAGLVHAAVAILSFRVAKSLLRRGRWSSSGALILAVSILSVMCYWIEEVVVSKKAWGWEDVVFPACVGSLMVGAISTLRHPKTKAWCHRTVAGPH